MLRSLQPIMLKEYCNKKLIPCSYSEGTGYATRETTNVFLHGKAFHLLGAGAVIWKAQGSVGTEVMP